MLRLFQSSNPFSIVFYFIFSVAMQLHLILHPASIAGFNHTLTGHLFFENLLHIQNANIYLITGIHILIISLEGILISLVVQRNKIIQKSSLIPAAVFVVITSWFPEIQLISPQIITAFLITPVLFKIFSTYNKTKIDSTIFDTGLITTVASLFFYPAIVFCAFSIFAIFRLRSTSFREFLVYLSGVFVIYFLTLTTFFWFDLLPEFAQQFYLPHSLPSVELIMSPVYLVRLILLGIVFITSVWLMGDKFSSNTVQIRKYFGSFINLFVFSILILAFCEQITITDLYFLFIPVTVFIAWYFAQTKQRLYAEFIFWGMIGTAIIFQYSNFV